MAINYIVQDGYTARSEDTKMVSLVVHWVTVSVGEGFTELKLDRLRLDLSIVRQYKAAGQPARVEDSLIPLAESESLGQKSKECALKMHQTLSGNDIYGPGTYIDKDVLPVPEDARRVFELLATRTPGFTDDRALWETVKFEGRPEPMIPGPMKSPVVSAALHAMCGLVGNELLELRDGTPAKDSSVTVNTDHAGIWLGSTFTAYVNGSDISTLARNRTLSTIFQRDFEQGFGVGPLAGRATALYPTKDPKVWYQLHGSLDASKTLTSMGIDMNVPLGSFAEGYDYIRQHVQRWSADELEMHNVRHGLCGSICYSPEGWRKTEMGKRLAEHPLVNYTHESYARPTPPIPLPSSPDRRPLAGIKVLEMVRIISGPTVGVTLASFGADVIRVNCSRLPDLNVRGTTLGLSSH